MEHFYQAIPGYFSFPDFYTWLASVQPFDSHGVEVGSYAGRSAAFLAVELINRERGQAKLDLVDNFTGGGGTPVEVLGRLSPVASVVGRAIGVSERSDGSGWFEDGSLDYVFIDADHHYAAVRRDIDVWLPKVKKGGVIAGHDYAAYPGFGVIEAVTETFPRVEVWRGEIFDGDGIRDFSHDAAWINRYYPCWAVRL